MNRFLKFVSAMLTFGLIAAPLVVRAQAPKTQTVEFPSGKETASGFLAVPDKPGVYPGLVVIHEWWGLNDWVKEQSEKLAEQGYIVLAVDLYHGKSAADPADAHELMRGMPQDRGHPRHASGLRVLGCAQGCEAQPYRRNWLVHGRRPCATTRDPPTASRRRRGELRCAPHRSQ